MIETPKCPACGSYLEFAVEVKATLYVRLEGTSVMVRSIDGGKYRLEFSGDDIVASGVVDDAIRDGDSEDGELGDVYVRCVMRHHTVRGDAAAAFASSDAVGGPDLEVGDVVLTDQNVARRVCAVHDRGAGGVLWADEHGELWKARQVVKHQARSQA